MTTTLLRRKKAKMYGIAPSGDGYYAFWADGRAGLYVDGTFVSYRSTSGPEIPEAPSLIHEDSEAIVGAGSIAFRVDSTHFFFNDTATTEIYTYDVPAGYVTTPPIYADGFLWWIEREAAQHGGTGTHKTWFRLRKARTDLVTELATVQSYEAAHHVGFSVLWELPVGLALTTAAAIIQNHWLDEAAGEVQDDFQVRLERDGTGATDNGWYVIGPGIDVTAWVFNTAPPLPSGAAAGATSTGLLAEVADDAEASPDPFWSGAEWELGGCTNVSVSADGSDGSVYNGGGLVRGPASTGTPTKLFSVGPAPAPEEDTPYYFFIKG